MGAKVSTKLYLAIGAWLAGLMLLSVVLTERHVAGKVIVQIVIGLSTIKAFLVALYYMHLKSDRRILLVIAVFPFVLIALAFGVVASSFFIKL
jgi:caa(3)-type oxidase subunit IV